jgi:hypothetical protein
MLAFDTPARWTRRGQVPADPAWTQLKDDPKYAGHVSNITNLVLRPLPGTQI